MRNFLLSFLLLTTTAFAALSELDKSFYSQRNLILNPGFEAGKNSWTTNTATFAATTTAANVLNGTASGSLLITSNGGYLRSKTVTLPTALYGQACEAQVLYKGGDALTTLEVYNANNTLLGSLALTAHTDAGFESVFFLCPSATDVGGDANKGKLYVQIKQTTAGTHTIMYTDNWYLGRLQNLASTTQGDLFSAKVSSADVVSDENIDWINGNCTNATTGVATCVFVSGTFSVAPNCIAAPLDSNGNNDLEIQSISSSQVVVRSSANGTAVDRAFILACQKQGVDSIQSRQVYKSIPTVNSVINEFSAKISTSDVVSDENTDWINGNCTNASTGQQTCNFVSGTFSNTPNCTVVSNSAANNYCYVSAVSSTAATTICVVGATGVASDTATVLSCQKAGSDFKMPVVQPIVVGQVSQSQNTALKIATAKVSSTCTSSPCTIASGFNITSITRQSTGNYTMNYEANYFTQAPFCTVTQATNSSGMIPATTTTSTTFATNNAAGTSTDTTFDIICFGY